MLARERMTPLDSRCLELFPAWLQSLADDARALCQVLENSPEEGLKRSAAAALNYLFKSIDLIPDGLEDLGFMDDAFVFRVAMARAQAAGVTLEPGGAAERLSTDAGLIAEFLGADYEHLEAYVDVLGDRPVRGRSVDALVTEAAVREELQLDLQSWVAAFEPPAFFRDAKNLVKLRAFLSTKLAPAAP
jgi:uncharacterized membrane protein YkvA (DUF1232 family)